MRDTIDTDLPAVGTTERLIGTAVSRQRSPPLGALSRARAATRAAADLEAMDEGARDADFARVRLLANQQCRIDDGDQLPNHR